jgi:plasmid stabilization system protein ParE
MELHDQAAEAGGIVAVVVQTVLNVVRRIRARIGKLETRGLARMGRPGLDPGTRELVEPPYIIVYEVHEAQGEVHVLYIVHGAQDREGGGNLQP